MANWELYFRNKPSSLKYTSHIFRLSGELKQIGDSQEDFLVLKSEDFSFWFFLQNMVV